MNTTSFLITLIVVIVVMSLISYYAHCVKPFMVKRAYIKMEMSRSADREYNHWKKELKYNRLLLIPFIGMSLKRRIR